MNLRKIVCMFLISYGLFFVNIFLFFFEVSLLWKVFVVLFKNYLRFVIFICLGIKGCVYRSCYSNLFSLRGKYY